MQKEYCIQFERSGGFIGQLISCEICRESLPEAERNEFDQLVKHSGIFNYNPEDSISPGYPDQYQYNFITKVRKSKQTIKFNDSNLPDQFRPLVNYFIKTSRKKQ